jgi:hypothetical protein
MAGGEQRLGHEEVVRDPLEVGEGSAGAHLGLSTVVQLDGEKPVMGAETGGAGGVGDGLRIGAELMEVAAGAVHGRRRRCMSRRSHSASSEVGVGGLL